MHIFELDDRFRVSQYVIWNMSLTLLFIWTCFYCFNILEIATRVKEDIDKTGSKHDVFHMDWNSIIVFSIFLVLCMQPCVKTF